MKTSPVSLGVFFFAVELFAWLYLTDFSAFSPQQLWPLAFGALWAVLLTCLICIFPRKVGRVLYSIAFSLSLVYSIGQTGYYLLFNKMMWLSDFLYASEGADYLDVVFSYPAGWFVWILGLLIWGGIHIRWFPRVSTRLSKRLLGAFVAVVAASGLVFLPQAVFLRDRSIQYAGSDYGRSKSAEAAYNNMFDAHRLYEVCGLYQTSLRDIYANMIYPLSPAYALEQAKAEEEIDDYFAENESTGPNENAMTGVLKGKNVVLVLMESMDDWLLGEHTPTINRLMDQGIRFDEFYTPVYGGIRTFNTEFCINTGSFLSSRGGYAFDYVTNDYSQSLASQLEKIGYSSKTFHYNDPSFYSRDVFSEAMGYEEYVCYEEYLEEGEEELLYDDQLLFDEEGISREFFREGPSLNFIITRSAHLSYRYNEVLSHWALKKYPWYRGLTGNEEADCAFLKARLVDDLFARLLEELEREGTLENTVIIAVTDHYTYGVKDEELVLSRSEVEEPLLLERTPCFIWSAGLAPQRVDKTLNTADLLPTVLNMLGIRSEDPYIGSDAFDPEYIGFAPFADGSWISGDILYDADSDEVICMEETQPVTEEFLEDMERQVERFIYINNLILETDYYNS